MAFNLKSLVLSTQSNRDDGTFTRKYFYSSTDASATVLAAGYFNAAGTRLAVGDIIVVSCGIGGTPATLVLRVTAATAGSNFTVANAIVTS